MTQLSLNFTSAPLQQMQRSPLLAPLSNSAMPCTVCGDGRPYWSETDTYECNKELREFDVILINTSAGKDSLVMLDAICKRAKLEGLLNRVVVVHADLGRAEWKGTRELAERQAAKYGVRFEVVSRPQGDLLDQVEERGMWPSSSARYCTSDHKRGQVAKLITKLTKELDDQDTWEWEPTILNCMGLRADESSERAKRHPFTLCKRGTNSKRTVYNWLPIHHWSEDQVWDHIRSNDLEYHYAYDLGMSRLSCVFCVFAPVAQLQLAAAHNPELLEEYLEVERKIDHDFQNGRSLAESVTMHQIAEVA